MPQSIAIFLGIVALAFAPMALYFARRIDQKREATTAEFVPLEVGVARHMYGEAVGHEPGAMQDYDESPQLQALWQNEAGYKLSGR